MTMTPARPVLIDVRDLRLTVAAWNALEGIDTISLYEFDYKTLTFDDRISDEVRCVIEEDIRGALEDYYCEHH